MQTQLMKKKLKKYNKIISKFNKENKNICDDELLRENHVCTWVCWCETLMNKKIVLEQEKLHDLLRNKVITKDVYNAQMEEKGAYFDTIHELVLEIEEYLGE